MQWAQKKKPPMSSAAISAAGIRTVLLGHSAMAPRTNQHESQSECGPDDHTSRLGHMLDIDFLELPVVQGEQAVLG